MHSEDLTGKKFGRLTVLKKVGSNERKQVVWLCQCDCGSPPIEVTSASLKSGNTKSCGCIKREMLITRNYRHGLSRTEEYEIWKSMNQRCHNKNNKQYPNYGGRGITVCERWRGKYGFENFIEDMGKKLA